MTEQAQAEDRRLQLMVDLDAIIHKRADCLRIQEAAAIAEAIAELTRLSRVEQALRESLSFFADETLLDAVDDDTMSGIRPCPPSTCMRIRDVRRWHQALTASPEAQPEEGK